MINNISVGYIVLFNLRTLLYGVSFVFANAVNV